MFEIRRFDGTYTGKKVKCEMNSDVERVILYGKHILHII